MKFRVGDRVKCQGYLATIVKIDTDNTALIRYDNHELGWSITEEDHKRGHHRDLPIGRGYFWICLDCIIFVGRPKKIKLTPVSKALMEADFSATKEKVEQETVIRLTDNFVKMLKETW